MKTIIKRITDQTNLSEQEAWWLIEHITQQARIALTIHNYKLSEQEHQTLTAKLQEIINRHKPLAYIIGWVPFLDCTITVQPPTLIPRPETEEWVDHLITTIKNTHLTNLTILDIGTGSGCIAISLAKAFPDAVIYAIDIAPQALQLAEHNAQKNNVNNIRFIQSDLFAALPTNFVCDLIVSNPPYIPPTAHLEPSVANWEDPQALFAQNNGLELIEKIIDQAPHFLQNSLLPYNCVIEIDMTHGDIIQQILERNQFTEIVLRKDQHHKNRTVWGLFKTLEK